MAKPLLVRLAIAAALAVAPSALADSLYVGTLERPNVLIREIKDGKIYYEISGRVAQPIEIDRVSRLDITDEPALSAAEKAFTEGQWDQAADQYQKALRTTGREWVKDYAIPRLLEAAAKSNRFDAAVTAYVQLVLRNPAQASKYKPALPTGESGYVNQAADDVRKALGEPKLTDSQRQQLLLFLLDIQRARKDDAGVEQVAGELAKLAASAPDTGPAAAARLKLGLAHVALDEKNWQKAIDQIESAKELFNGPEQMADALFVIAEANRGLAEKTGDADALKDAAIAYMRVVAHFKDNKDLPQVAQSLYRAARLLETLKETAAAKELYAQVVAQYAQQPVAAQAKEALARLKSTP